MSRKILGFILGAVLIFGLGVGIGTWVIAKNDKVKPEVAGASRDKYVAFLDEVYSTIMSEYWNKLSDQDLIKIFVLGTEKITGQTQSIKGKEKSELMAMFKEIVNSYPEEEKKKGFVVTLSDLVLQNLEPFGRSRLYAQKDEKALSDTVSNVTEVDHYKELGVDKDASKGEIAAAFEKQKSELEDAAETDPEAKQKLEEINKSYKVLSDDSSKNNYDVAGIDPTVDYKLLASGVSYIHITKFSPTTFDELVRATEQLDKGESDSLIFDLRDNIGGAIDGLPYFLGPFIGNDQYAYQFFHQGDKLDFKTRTGWLNSLVRYKKVVILINKNSQSTAELMAASMKKYNVGVLVGEATKGWGTVERVFPLKQQIDKSEKYSIFLVHSLTLKEDGEPIEGHGVEPVIKTADNNWQGQLESYFNYKPLVDAVDSVLKLDGDSKILPLK